MTAIAGPVKSYSIAGREFRAVADADVTLQLGGFNKERLVNGDGSTRPKMTPVPWKASGCSVEIDPDNGDLEFLEDVKNSPDDVPITVTRPNDTTYGGLGSIEGELSESISNAAASFELTGEGKLVKQ